MKFWNKIPSSGYNIAISYSICWDLDEIFWVLDEIFWVLDELFWMLVEIFSALDELFWAQVEIFWALDEIFWALVELVWALSLNVETKFKHFLNSDAHVSCLWVMSGVESPRVNSGESQS